MNKINLIIESLREVNEAGIRDIKLGTIEDVIKGRTKVSDYISKVDKNDILKQIVKYVKSLKSLKDVKDTIDFFNYGGKGYDIATLYDSFKESDRNDLYNYADKLSSKLGNKYKQDFVKLLKAFEEYDNKYPNVLEEFVVDKDVDTDVYDGRFCYSIYTEKTGASSLNVNNKYEVLLWFKGDTDDSDWLGYVSDYGLCRMISGPVSCYRYLSVVLGDLYLCYAFLENWSKLKKEAYNFIKINLENYRKKLESFKSLPLNKKLEKFDNMADKATFIFDTVIEEMGYKLDTLHLISYSEWEKFRDKLTRILRTYQVDLSFKEGYSWKYGIKLSGNADGIVSDFWHDLINKQWEKVEFSKQDIINHFNKYPKAKVYTEDRFGHAVLSNREKVFGTKFGSSYQDMGYGSQASTTETTVELYKDKFGNLKVSERSFTWD